MLVLDVETTISNKGNPFDHRNRLCYFGSFDGDSYNLLDVHYGTEIHRQNLERVRSLVSDNQLVIGFNLKFDLHWLRRYGINFSHCDVWDCQLVQFILSSQTLAYPSLNEVAAIYGIGSKLDTIASKYWDKGIDTPDIPREELEEYLQEDLWLTYQVYLKQKEQI